MNNQINVFSQLIDDECIGEFWILLASDGKYLDKFKFIILSCLQFD